MSKAFLQEGDAFAIPEFHKRGYRDPDDPRYKVEFWMFSIFLWMRKFKFWQLVITLSIFSLRKFSFTMKRN